MLSNKEGSFLVLPGSKSGEEIHIPLYNPHDEPPVVSITKADDMTYRQLMDAIGIALNYSNQDSQAYLAAARFENGVPTQEGKRAFESLLQAKQGKIEVNLTSQGRIQISDEMRSISRMKFMIYNAKSNDFSEDALHNHTTFLSFNANNALTIDQPDINFFDGLDEMIKAVRNGIYRPDMYGDNYVPDMRNIGIQNSIELFGHFSNHIEKMIAQNGAHGRSFENALRRNEVLKVQIASIKNDNIGTDMAQTYNHFSNLTTNYNAILASTSRINQMSLVNYL